MFVEKPLVRSVQLPAQIKLVVLISVDFEGHWDFSHHTETLPDYYDFYEHHFDGRRGIWRLLEVLARHQINTTFFICGAAVEEHRNACKEIEKAGYEIAGHSYRHEYFYKLTGEQEQTAFQKMIAAFQDFYGKDLVGFRTCHPKPPRTLDAVVRHGFRYDSSLRDDDMPYVLQRDDGRYLVEIPRGANGDAAMVGTPVASQFGSGKYNIPSEVASHWKAEFDRCYQEGNSRIKFFSLCLHSYISGRPSRAKALDGFLAYTKQFPGVWYATYAEVADLWLKAI